MYDADAYQKKWTHRMCTVRVVCVSYWLEVQFSGDVTARVRCPALPFQLLDCGLCTHDLVTN